MPTVMKRPTLQCGTVGARAGSLKQFLIVAIALHLQSLETVVDSWPRRTLSDLQQQRGSWLNLVPKHRLLVWATAVA